MRVKNVIDDSTKTITLHGVFIAIGHSPNTGIFDTQLDMENGYLIVQSHVQGNATATSIPGVFAAGDVSDCNGITYLKKCLAMIWA